MHNTQRMVVNESFSYHSQKTDCVMDVIHNSSGERGDLLRVRSCNEHEIRFAFASGDGLVRLAHTGAIDDENVIGHFLSLHPGNPSETFEFFRNNGFLFPISTEQYETFHPEMLDRMIVRFKSTVQLMTALDGAKTNWETLLAPTLILLMGDSIRVSTNDGAPMYESFTNKAMMTIEKASELPDIDGSSEAYQKNTYTIDDSVYGPSYELDSEIYEDIVAGTAVVFTRQGCSDRRFRNIVKAYRAASNIHPDERLVIDFLFHLMMDVGIIGTVDYFTGPDFLETPKFEGMNDQLCAALERVARIVVRDEINHNISRIRPKYDPKMMAPSWEIPDLLSAMYFSLFFMRPGVEVYRECANPNCNVHFLVKTTATRNKYCCPACANATAQRNHRRRKAQK